MTNVREAEERVIEQAWSVRSAFMESRPLNEPVLLLCETLIELSALDRARAEEKAGPSVSIPAGVHPSNLTTVIEVAESRVREIAREEIARWPAGDRIADVEHANRRMTERIDAILKRVQDLEQSHAELTHDVSALQLLAEHEQPIPTCAPAGLVKCPVVGCNLNTPHEHHTLSGGSIDPGFCVAINPFAPPTGEIQRVCASIGGENQSTTRATTAPRAAGSTAGGGEERGHVTPPACDPGRSTNAAGRSGSSPSPWRTCATCGQSFPSLLDRDVHSHQAHGTDCGGTIASAGSSPTPTAEERIEAAFHASGEPALDNLSRFYTGSALRAMLAEAESAADSRGYERGVREAILASEHVSVSPGHSFLDSVQRSIRALLPREGEAGKEEK